MLNLSGKLTPSIGGTPPAGEIETIFTVTTANFQNAVLMASMARPVLAYFTASWCGPCKQLRPALEKVVQAQGGKIGLAVIDIDQNPDLAGAMRVQSVPQIYAFVGGQPADGFMGALPESEIKEFIAKVLKMAGIAAAPDEAAGNPADPFADARAVWSDGNLAAAIIAYKTLQPDTALKPRAEKATTFLNLLLPYGSASALANAESAATKTAESQHTLALAALAHGQFERGFDALLASIKAERKWQEERARTDFVTLSEILGLEDPLVVAARRKLSSILFS